MRLGTVVTLFVAAALALRLWELDGRPLHHDESLDAWWSWLYRNGGYTGYDPVYHGPLRFYITAGFFELFGESEAVARLFSALTGTAVVGLPWFLRKELGRAGTITACAALCLSPTMLYYSRFGREDAQMVFLTLLSLVLGLAYLRRPRVSVAASMAFVLACSFAIKESTYLFGLLLAVYVLVVVAAQFDAQTRTSHNAQTRTSHNAEPDLDRAFFGSAIALAAVGLIAATVIGSAADELFPMLALYGLGLGVFVVAAALPQLRRAAFEWPAPRVGRFAGAVAVLLLVMAIAAAAGGDSPEGAWTVSPLGVIIGLALLGASIAVLGGERIGLELPEIAATPRARGYAGAALLTSLAILANEYVEADERRILVIVVAAGVTFSAAVAIDARPRATSDDFRWPPLVRSLGAIGWWGWFVSLAVFAVAWFLFFTVWGEVKQDWPSGFTRAIEYWDSQQEVNRGGQPWYYYLYALPAYEWLFVAMAAVGGWRALRRPTVMSGLFVWFAIGSLILYSYAGERMPWLIAHPLLPVLILAGFGAQELWERRDHATAPAIATVLAFAMIATGVTSIRASFPNGADSREILSQAGQATPHLTAALERLENIDSIAMRETGQPATLAIGTANAWPYNWYLRDRPNVMWFSNDAGPPTDGSADVIIVDYGIIDPVDFPQYQSTVFAMRSWWVPTYTEAGIFGWIGWVRDRTLWEQGPNSGFAGVSPEGDATAGGLSARLKRIQHGADEVVADWLGFAGADRQALELPDQNRFIEADDGRDGCGSVDQWFMVHNDYAFTEAQVYPAPIASMGPLDCASDLLATS